MALLRPQCFSIQAGRGMLFRLKRCKLDLPGFKNLEGLHIEIRGCPNDDASQILAYNNLPIFTVVRELHDFMVKKT